MSADPYDRLSGMDQTFLVFESPTTHMHVAATLIFEEGSLSKPNGGVDVERIRAYTESRLHLIPRYRQRLGYTPIDNHPIWIDDEHFNIDYHVRHASLPRPGDERQLKRLAGRVMSQPLDRARPLWEIWVVEGLEGGRFALLAKTHHCMIDGLAAVDLLSVMLSNEISEETEEAPAFVPRPLPSRLRLARDEVLRLATSPFGIVGALRRGLEEPEELVAAITERVTSLTGMLGIGLRKLESTPLNQPIGPHRRFDWLAMELSDFREVKKRLGGTVNDIVLATVAGAVGTFLEQRGSEADSQGFRVLTPVSTRTDEDSGRLGNRVSMWLIDLPIGERDPRLRLDRIRDTTAELKEAKRALGAEMLTRATNWTGSALLSAGVQLLHRSLPFNLIVTNVPGPQVPLYLLGSRLLETYPQVPLFKNQGLGVALFSYNGRLFWGFNADWDLLRDVSLFADSIVASFSEMRAAAVPVEIRSRARKTASQTATPTRPVAEA